MMPLHPRCLDAHRSRRTPRPRPRPRASPTVPSTRPSSPVGVPQRRRPAGTSSRFKPQSAAGIASLANADDGRVPVILVPGLTGQVMRPGRSGERPTPLCQAVPVPHRQTRTRTLARRGELIVEVDPWRPSGRLLRQAGMDGSYIDLADITHLEFDYMRWLRIVLRVAGARRVLHIGGGACALARALAAEDPTGLQEVCEFDADCPGDRAGASRAAAGPRAAGPARRGSRPPRGAAPRQLGRRRHRRVHRRAGAGAADDRRRPRRCSARCPADPGERRRHPLGARHQRRHGCDGGRLPVGVDPRSPPREHDHRRLCHRHSPRPEARRRARRRRPVTRPRRPTAEGRSSLGKVSVIRRARVPV